MKSPLLYYPELLNARLQVTRKEGAIQPMFVTKGGSPITTLVYFTSRQNSPKQPISHISHRARLLI